MVDDHPLMREGVIKTLKLDAFFDVVAVGASAADAIRIAGTPGINLMLLDLSMPGGGLEAAKVICRDHPAIKLVILTVSEREDDVISAMAAGAAGYVLKGVSGPDLLVTLKAVSMGETYVTPDLAARLLKKSRNGSDGDHADDAQLTPREEQILHEVTLGLTNKEIALKLDLSEKTIKHYMTSVLQKLRARNRVEAVLAGMHLKRD